MVSCVNASKCTSHFLFYDVQCCWFYVEVFDPFELEFVYGGRYGSIFIILHVNIQLYQHHFLNTLSFFNFVFLLFLEKSGVGRCVD